MFKDYFGGIKLSLALLGSASLVLFIFIFWRRYFFVQIPTSIQKTSPNIIENTATDSGRHLVQKNLPPTRSISYFINGTLVAAGDAMLGRSINTWQSRNQDYTLAWQEIAPIFQEANLALVNLETPIITDCPLTDEGMSFCAPLRAIDGLKFAGVDVVNLANNHTRNHGHAGLAETRAVLDLAAINFVGENGDGYGNLVIKEIAGLKIGFLGFDDVSQTLDAEKVMTQIREARAQVDTLVTTWHWGSEYTAQPSARQIALAHAAVENGANLIIGHHPHWIQSSEIYLEAPIYYSLGNLIFDQFWSAETMRGLIVKFQFTAQKSAAGDYEITWQAIEEIEVSIGPPGQARLVEN